MRLLKALPSALGSSIYFAGDTSRAPSYCLQAIRLQDRRSDFVWPSREQEQQAQQAQMAAAAVHQETQLRLQQARAQRAQQQQQLQQRQQQQRQVQAVAAAAADLQSQQGVSSPNLGGVESLLQAPPRMQVADTATPHTP